MKIQEGSFLVTGKHELIIITMTARNEGYDFFPIQTLLLEHNKT